MADRSCTPWIAVRYDVLPSVAERLCDRPGRSRRPAENWRSGSRKVGVNPGVGDADIPRREG